MAIWNKIGNLTLKKSPRPGINVKLSFSLLEEEASFEIIFLYFNNIEAQPDLPHSGLYMFVLALD